MKTTLSIENNDNLLLCRPDELDDRGMVDDDGVPPGVDNEVRGND